MKNFKLLNMYYTNKNILKKYEKKYEKKCIIDDIYEIINENINESNEYKVKKSENNIDICSHDYTIKLKINHKDNNIIILGYYYIDLFDPLNNKECIEYINYIIEEINNTYENLIIIDNIE